MSGENQHVFFKAILPNKGSTDAHDRIWIHPSGKRAVLFDPVSKQQNPISASNECIAICEKVHNRTFPDIERLIAHLHEGLSEKNMQAVGAIVDWHGDRFVIASVGNARLYGISDGRVTCPLGEPQIMPMQVLGIKGIVTPKIKSIRLDHATSFILTSDGIDVEGIKRNSVRLSSAGTEHDWRELAEMTSIVPDWSMLVFPVGDQLEWMMSKWPYDPFVGKQEERAHEQRGLIRLADELFKRDDFRGFKIVGSAGIEFKHSTRSLDGILVSPWGIVLLELKDHDGDIDIYLGKRNMVVHLPEGEHRETSPVEKVDEALRSFSEWNVGIQLDTELRKIGAVIFTNPNVHVYCIRPEEPRKKHSIPDRKGHILICKPESVAEQLRRFVGRRKKPALSTSDIIRVVETLHEQVNVAHKRNQLIGSYEINPVMDEKHETGYYDLFLGKHMRTGKEYVVKRFQSSTIRGGNDGDMLIREFEALQELVDEGISVQRCREVINEGEFLYVILEKVLGQNLRQWLQSKPERLHRIHVLNQLAEILNGLAEALPSGIVHRAISPSNIIIKGDGHVVLTNFELCKLDYLATLPLEGRRHFDMNFMSREVNIPGGHTTPAADSYSYGKVALYLLLGKLPFDTYEDQARLSRKSGFWASLMQESGLPEEDLRSLLSPAARKRPVGVQLVEMVRRWK